MEKATITLLNCLATFSPPNLVIAIIALDKISIKDIIAPMQLSNLLLSILDKTNKETDINNIDVAKALNFVEKSFFNTLFFFKSVKKLDIELKGSFIFEKSFIVLLNDCNGLDKLSSKPEPLFNNPAPDN